MNILLNFSSLFLNTSLGMHNISSQANQFWFKQLSMIKTFSYEPQTCLLFTHFSLSSQSTSSHKNRKFNPYSCGRLSDIWWQLYPPKSNLLKENRWHYCQCLLGSGLSTSIWIYSFTLHNYDSYYDCAYFTNEKTEAWIR